MTQNGRFFAAPDVHAMGFDALMVFNGQKVTYALPSTSIIFV